MISVVDSAVAGWRRDGFAVVPLLTPDDLAPARADLGLLFPSAEEFHDDVDPERNARFRDEFAGITPFPFPSPALGCLAVHDKVVGLAAALLGTDRLRVGSMEAWAKYTGAADYAQPHHRDYLSHTLLVPTDDPAFRQVEMFVYLCDVPADLGPPAFVPSDRTRDRPALPNWYPRVPEPPDPDHPSWGSPLGHPDIYAAEVSAAGPAGTVVAYSLETFHRGTALTRPRGARYTLHVTFRGAGTDWVGRRAWATSANTPEWHRFVSAATPRQLELFGFPPPGHAYWTPSTLAGMRLRYPDLDLTPWRRADGPGGSGSG